MPIQGRRRHVQPFGDLFHSDLGIGQESPGVSNILHRQRRPPFRPRARLLKTGVFEGESSASAMGDAGDWQWRSNPDFLLRAAASGVVGRQKWITWQGQFVGKCQARGGPTKSVGIEWGANDRKTQREISLL